MLARVVERPRNPAIFKMRGFLRVKLRSSVTTRTSGSPNTPRTILRARKPANEYPSDSRRCPLADFAIPHDARSPRRSKSPKANVHRPLHYFNPPKSPTRFPEDPKKYSSNLTSTSTSQSH